MNQPIQSALEARFGKVPTACLLNAVHRLVARRFYPTAAIEELESDFIAHLFAAEEAFGERPKAERSPYLVRSIQTHTIALARAAHKARQCLPASELCPKEPPCALWDSLLTTTPDFASVLDCETLLAAVPRALRPIVQDVMAGVPPSTACRQNGFVADTFRRRIAPLLAPLLKSYVVSGPDSRRKSPRLTS